MSIQTIKTTVQSIFQFANKYVTYVLLIIIAILIVMYSIERSGKNSLNNNLIITKDSVKYLTNKSNELYAQVNTYIITEKQLKLVNSELYDEVEKYKKQKPLVVVKEKIKIEYKDTTIISSISSKLDKYGNKQFDLSWSADSIFDKDNYIKINGMSYVKIDSTLSILDHGSRLNDLEIVAKLYLNVNEDKSGKLVINARTDFANLKFLDMEGYIIDPMKIDAIKNLAKKKRYGISAFGGVGTFFDGGGIKFIPTVGVGISYDLISF